MVRALPCVWGAWWGWRAHVDRAALSPRTCAAPPGFVRYFLSAGRGGFGLSGNECISSSFYCIVYAGEKDEKKAAGVCTRARKGAQSAGGGCGRHAVRSELANWRRVRGALAHVVARCVLCCAVQSTWRGGR